LLLPSCHTWSEQIDYYLSIRVITN
jgi:hypothetical protein